MARANFSFLMILLLLSCANLSESAFRKRPPHMPIFVFGRPFGGFLNHPRLHKYSTELSVTYPNVKTEYLEQKVDNFNPNDTRTYKQRYMYNMQFYNNNGLAFLLIGGESEITENWMGNPNYTWLVWAKKHGAACFQPEHRYFGESQPFKDISVQSYKYFTIEQAMADLRNFILQMNKNHFANFKNPRWVLFGGSYPGALAAWFREKNEDITIASIASSGVVQSRVDYYDYAENVEYVLRTVNPACPDAVRKGMEETIELTYTVDGRRQLKEIYNTCQPLPEPPTQKDIQNFLANIFYLFEGITQYTGDNRDLPRKEGLGVPETCKIMTDNSVSNYSSRIQKVFNFYSSFFGDEGLCNDISYTDYMKAMNDTSLNTGWVDARGWAWMCCTQLGFQQTTDNGKSIFGSSIPLDFYTDQCMDLFGNEYDTDRMREGVDAILGEYGGYGNYKGTRVVFANGSFDPWKSVCCLNCNSTENELYSVMTEGGAHCVEMYPANATHDSESLKNIRAFIEQKLDSFVEPPEPTVKPPEPPVKPGTADAVRKSILLILISVFGSFLMNF